MLIYDPRLPVKCVPTEIDQLLTELDGKIEETGVGEVGPFSAFWINCDMTTTTGYNSPSSVLWADVAGLLTPHFIPDPAWCEVDASMPYGRIYELDDGTIVADDDSLLSSDREERIDPHKISHLSPEILRSRFSIFINVDNDVAWITTSASLQISSNQPGTHKTLTSLYTFRRHLPAHMV